MKIYTYIIYILLVIPIDHGSVKIVQIEEITELFCCIGFMGATVATWSCWAGLVGCPGVAVPCKHDHFPRQKQAQPPGWGHRDHRRGGIGPDHNSHKGGLDRADGRCRSRRGRRWTAHS